MALSSLKPAAFAGRLSRKSSSAAALMNLSRFRAHFFLLKDGYLYWTHDSCRDCDREDDDQEWAGWINLSLTPCEVGPVTGKNSRIILQPSDGHKWSELDPHSAAGTDRPVLLDATASEHSADEWLVQIAKHIGFSKTLPAPSLSAAIKRLEFPEEGKFSEPCPICFEDIQPFDGIRAGCGHMFHKACLADWLEAQMRPIKKPKNKVPPQGSCPLCREVLVDSRQADTLGKLPSPIRPWHLCTRC